MGLSYCLALWESIDLGFRSEHSIDWKGAMAENMCDHTTALHRCVHGEDDLLIKSLDNNNNLMLTPQNYSVHFYLFL